MEEIWKDIKGYEGKYQVSSLGRVKSFNYLGTGKERILKPKKTRGGYLCICLCKNGITHDYRLNRLVYDTFVGIDKPYRRNTTGDNIWVINHKDENIKNNSLENLELITLTENNRYGTAIERLIKANVNNPKTSRKVYQYNCYGELIKIWPSTRECNRNGYDCRRVSECCNQKGRGTFKRQYKGYIWSYSELHFGVREK